MTRSHLDRAARTAVLAALALASLGARADPGFSFSGGTVGAFIPTDTTLPPVVVYGDSTVLPDGSQIAHLGCVPSTIGGIGCDFVGPVVVDTWYKRANQPTTAAAQAFANFGLLKARSWRTEGGTGDSQPGDPPGTRSYYAEANAEWRENLIYTGPAPTWVTMQFTLHAAWNDLGRWGFTVGQDTIGAENVRIIDGVSYVNCAGPIECGGGAFGAQAIPVAGNDAANTSGEVTLAINYGFWLNPQVSDPEDPGPAEPFSFAALLQTRSSAPGAEADAFQTVTLDRILIEPGAQITFASGNNWPVQVVPEPETVLLWLAGLAAVVPLARRRRAAG